MCGVCGELRFDHTQVAPSVINKMLPALQRRGPDAEGRYFEGPVGLGHRRLAIIDLNPRSNQPLRDSDLGLVLVFNGTIYNYPQLRLELIALGFKFFTEGDSEVILKAYSAWGEFCVERLHGMFAFAIWDERRQELFVARDRLGIKPLYFTRDAQRFAFASTIQSLLAAGNIDTRLDPKGLHFLFSLHAVVPAPYTVLRGVSKLEPATCTTLSATGTQRSRRYWELRSTRPATPRTETEWLESVHRSLVEAVRKRKTIADVPVGLLLSGGLDSSLLVALLVDAGVHDLQTFSVGFEDSPEESGSEFIYSDQVVEQFHTRHHKFLIPNDQVLKRLPETVQAMSEPMFSQDAIGFYLLAEQVSKHVKVVQSGQGADEVFGGYFWYSRMAEDSGPALTRFSRHYFDRDHAEMATLLQAPYLSEDYTAEYIAARLSEPHADSFIDQVLRLDVTTLLVEDPVKRVDNMTMAWGLEARVPFLDHELIELAAQIPPELKLASGGKHLLKKLARGRIPDAVIDRPKGYFPVPALKYVRGPFRDFMHTILDSPACRQRGLYRREYIEWLDIHPGQALTRIKGSKLWQLALLELWLQLNVDTAGSANTAPVA